MKIGKLNVNFSHTVYCLLLQTATSHCRCSLQVVTVWTLEQSSVCNVRAPYSGD